MEEAFRGHIALDGRRPLCNIDEVDLWLILIILIHVRVVARPIVGVIFLYRKYSVSMTTQILCCSPRVTLDSLNFGGFASAGLYCATAMASTSRAVDQ